jgi:hypothetical protein
MSDTPTYNADQVLVQFAGITMSEKGKDEFVRIKRTTPAFTKTVGVDGKVVREQTNDDSATVEVILMATSPINDLLTAVHEGDKASKNGAGIAPLHIKDLNSDKELHFAEEAWISTVPEVTFARGVGERVWAIEVARLRQVFGGH